MAPTTCRCCDGWICEAHSDQPWPHDDCRADGEQCLNPDCPWWKGTKPAARDHSDWTGVTRVDGMPTPRRKPD
jgi:hypothetical protein